MASSVKESLGFKPGETSRDDPNFEWPQTITKRSQSKQSAPITRQKSFLANDFSSKNDEQYSNFSSVKIPPGQKTVDQKVIRFAVQCLPENKVSQNDVIDIIVTRANLIFKQRWTILGNSYDSDEKSESEENVESVQNERESEKKRQRS